MNQSIKSVDCYRFESLNAKEDENSCNTSNINNRHLNVSTLLEDLGLKQYKGLFQMEEVTEIAIFFFEHSVWVIHFSGWFTCFLFIDWWWLTRNRSYGSNASRDSYKCHQKILWNIRLNFMEHSSNISVLFHVSEYFFIFLIEGCAPIGCFFLNCTLILKINLFEKEMDLALFER